MRSAIPMPDNPWPHDMTITVEDRPHALLELLWLREAHSLNPDGEDLPPHLVRTPVPAATAVYQATRARWSRGWSGVWDEVLAHAGTEPDRALVDNVFSAEASDPDRARLLRQLTGPSVSDQFGAEVFDDATYQEWDRLGFESHVASRPTVLANSPERRSVAVLADAWRRGLTKVVTVPCVGTHVRQIGPHALLVTEEVRGDRAAYENALRSFAPAV